MKRNVLIFITAFIVVVFLTTFTVPFINLHSDIEGDFIDDYGLPVHWLRIHVHADYFFDGVFSHRQATTKVSVISLPWCILALTSSAAVAAIITRLLTSAIFAAASNSQ